MLLLALIVSGCQHNDLTQNEWKAVADDGRPWCLMRIDNDSFEILRVGIRNGDTFGVNPETFAHQGISESGKSLNYSYSGSLGKEYSGVIETEDFVNLYLKILLDSATYVNLFVPSDLPSIKELKSRQPNNDFIFDTALGPDMNSFPDSLVDASLGTE